ncbi:TolB family protein [Streptomyces sp. NPDC090025]|uniref:TolB family protein n=1 Tax=Streptomyces sp. NPDC090025 TaxID=3365922 RepID=UPI0038352ADC
MTGSPSRRRLWALVIGILLLGGGATAYTLRAAAHQPGGPGDTARTAADPGFTLDSGAPGALWFRDTGSGRVARQDPTAPGSREVGGPRCDRFHAAGPTALCLQLRPGIPARTYVIVLDRALRERQRMSLPGIPNRARVSASGQVLAWTTFVTGDSYNTATFATRTSILDLRTGYLIKSIEQIPLTLDGRRHHAPDVNYWGVSFAADDNRFYATVATQGRTHLVEGDLRKWSARALKENVECPSLSPDGARVAYKKKVSDDARAPWRLHVLDLATLREHPLAETRSVDDQAVWTGPDTVAYGYGAGTGSGVWSVPADGTGAPRLVAAGASSPVVLSPTTRR